MKSIIFSGIMVSSLSDDYVLQSIKDLESGTLRFNEYENANSDGSTVGKAFFNKREFSVEGTIIADNLTSLHAKKLALIRACNPQKPIVMTYVNDINKTYYATVKATQLPFFGNIQGYCINFILYFVIPSFYWNSAEITTPIWNNNSTNCIITISNNSVDVLPRLYIDIPTSTHLFSGNIITNETTGKIFKFGDIFHKGIYYFDFNTYETNLHESYVLSVDRLFLSPGENIIKVTSPAADNIYNFYFKYKENYLGV